MLLPPIVGKKRRPGELIFFIFSNYQKWDFILALYVKIAISMRLFYIGRMVTVHFRLFPSPSTIVIPHRNNSALSLSLSFHSHS